MNKGTIIIDISPAGGIKIDVDGFKGKACAKATEQIELVLGGGAVKRKEKPDYYASPVSSTQIGRMTF